MLLQIIAGPDEGQSYDCAEATSLLLGRDAAADIRLNDEMCSRRHARIVRDDGQVLILDQESVNGVFVNGVRTAKAVLAADDEIRLGNTVLRVIGLAAARDSRPAVSMREGSALVVASVHHAAADLLNKTAAPVLPDQAAQEHRILRHLCEISQVVAAHHDLRPLMEGILARVRDALQADTACILQPGDNGAWTVRASATAAEGPETVGISRTIVEQAVREGVAILSADTLSDARFVPSQSIIAQRMTSAICSPIKAHGAFVGVLFLDHRGHGGVFNPLDLRFVATVGNLLGVLIEREQLQIAARQRERLATIGEVMTGMAHCIKNIITGLRFSVTNLRLFLQHGKYDQAAEYVEHVTTQERRISDLILDMLSYAKEREPVRAPVDVRAVIETVVAPYRRELEKRSVRLQIEADPACPTIQAEEKGLQRVFLNLFTNAMDALEAKHETETREIRITLRPWQEQPGGVEVLLRDTGTGIPASKRDKLFEVFFSTKGASGTGLGLAVAQKIVQEHGGTITVDSCEGAWTEFRIALPAGTQGPAPAQPG